MIIVEILFIFFHIRVSIGCVSPSITPTIFVTGTLEDSVGEVNKETKGHPNGKPDPSHD